MKKKILIFILMFGVHSFILSNPIDDTPITCFSELVFDDNNNWTMELLFPFGYHEDRIDSVIIESSESRAKLKTNCPDTTRLCIITSDSLSTPLTINRNGDTLMIYTYWGIGNGKLFKKDSLIFGDCPGASVEKPIDGYSIYIINGKFYNNPWRVNCLTMKPSIGVENDSVGLAGIMRGFIYDRNKKLLPKFQPWGFYLELETPLEINSDGSFTTKIFPSLNKPGSIFVKIMDFPTSINTIEIDSFELKQIHPDTLVIQDIYLKSDCYFCDYPQDVHESSIENSELTLINYPNPFNSSTNFFVKIPDELKDKQGNIEIYNLNGQLIKTITVKGSGTIRWDGTSMNGNTLPSGIYYYRLNISNQVMKNGSMILLK